MGFEHPAAALDWCEKHTPSLVLVDFLLHTSNGIEVIRELRAMPALKTVPLVLMLPHGFETVSAEAWRQGASDFLAKPVDPTEFCARTRNLMALSSLRLQPLPPLLRNWQDARETTGRLVALH
jgi:DNA-binding response OmpR family regulator